jgi:hypothetical protein
LGAINKKLKMKIYNKILATGVVAVALTGCLKDDSTVLNPDKTENVIEFANTANLTSPTLSKYPLLSINVVMDPAGSHIADVAYSGAHDAPQDITVTVEVADSAVIKAYNLQNSKSYLVLPSNLYSIPTMQVTIPRGSRHASLPINFINPDQMFNKNYVLALKIKSTSYGQISGNFGTMLYLISAINRYDGIYTLKYRFGTNDRGYDLYPTTWFYSDVQLVTTGTTTAVLRNLYAASPYPHAATAGGLPTSISSFVPQFTFDLSTNNITNVTNSITTGTTKTAVPNPAVTNNRAEYSTTKNVFASFILKETGRVDMIINDTLIYKTPR